jgi:excisionase family DNA binding protein
MADQQSPRRVGFTELFSIPESAQMLGVTPKGLWAMVHRRDIESVKVGRLRRISRAAIERFIERNTTPAAQ